MTPTPSSNLHFVVRSVSRDRWRDLLSGEVPCISAIKHRIVNTEDVWIVLTYLHYRQRGLQVSIGTEPIADRVNVIDGALTRQRDFSPDCFYVVCRCDGPFPAMGHIVLHQNLLGTGKKNEVTVAQWPQPGLIKRDPARGTDIKTVAFFGHTRKNLSARFQAEAFLDELAKRDIEFLIKGKAETHVEWNDYSNVDVVIAVRDDIVDDTILRLKPVNKVTNAWLAGAICITGKEPAVSAAFPDSNAVLHASTPDDVLATIDRLRESPAEFARLIEEGGRLAEAYAEDAVAANWMRMEQTIAPVFARWQSQAKWRRWASYACRSVAHYTTRLIWKLGRHQM